MGPIIRNVKDIEADDRRSLEHVVGQPLRDDQQVIIKVTTIDPRDELSDTYAAQMEPATRAGWDDPAMGDDNDYDEHRPS